MPGLDKLRMRSTQTRLEWTDHRIRRRFLKGRGDELRTGERMTKDTAIKPEHAEIYWDAQDPKNTGWAYRLYSEGSEIGSGGCCDGLDRDAFAITIATQAKAELQAKEIRVYVEEGASYFRFRSAKDWRWIG